MKNFISAATLLLGVVVVGPSWSQQAAYAPKDPPFEQYHHILSEDGSEQLVVRYHVDHTYENVAMKLGGRDAGVTQRGGRVIGRWWWEGSAFCFQPSTGQKTAQKICKTNGNYIGRGPIIGSKDEAGAAQR